MIERVRRRRFRIAKLALLCFSVLLIAGAVVAVAFIQASPTRMVGAITITADQFTDLGNGLVHAQGNIKLGDQLALTGDGAEVLFDSDTLIGRGILSMDSTPLLSGEFRANIATGIAMPVTGASSKLAKVAGFAVAKPVEITQVDIPNATTTGKAVVSIGNPTQGATSTVNFSLFPGFLFSGVLPPLDLELAGVKLQAPSGAAMSNGMISIPKVALTLPPELGGGTTTVDDFQIAAEGVSVVGVNSTFVMPEMIWGDNAFRMVNVKGALVYDGTDFNYKFDVSGDLYVSVPGLIENTKAVMAVTTVDGQPQLVGQVDGLNLNLGTATLSTGPLVVGLEGLSTPVAQITVPPEYGGMTFTVTDVSITSEGLSVGGGAFSMPDLILADGAVTVSGVKAVVNVNEGAYEIAAEGTINLNLPDQQEPASITLVFGSDGLQGTATGLKINVAGADLVLGQATLDQYGLTATDAMFVLPPELGGVSGKVDKVTVTTEGLDFGAANMTLLLPDIPFGDAMTLMNNTAELKVVRSMEGDKYMLDVNGTLSISAGGQTSQEAVAFTLTAGSDGSVEINGSVGGLVLDLGGPILVVNDLTISNEGLSVAEAMLTLPAELGGATVAVSDVTITAEGIALNGGAVFALPEIVIAEGLTITGVEAKIVPVDGEYRTTAKGTLNVQLPGNETMTSVTLGFAEDGSLQGAATGLTLNVGGVTLALGDATLDSNGVSTTMAMVTLPPELGGITAQIGGVSIGAEGLSFSGGNMTIPLPDIPFGDMMSLTGNVAELKIVGTEAGQTYMLDVNSTLNMNVAGETKQETVNFTMSLAPDGTFEMAGNISGLALDLGVATLGLQDVAISTSGLTAAEAAITIPALGGATATVSDVGIGADGLSVGGGIFTLPELSLADGSVILSGIQAQLVPVDGAWTMAGQGTIQVSTGPDRPASIITFKVDSDGNVQGSASNLVADLGVALLEMGEMTWSNEGFGASDAKFTLNGPLGLSGNVDQVNIGADGLSFGNADMSVQLPEFAFGDYSFANNMVKLSAVNAAEGMQYIATIDTMMNAGAGQSNPLRITLAPGVSPDQMAAMGQVNGLALNIGGVTVVLEGLLPQ